MADITYSAEFSVTIDKLKKGVIETQNSLNELVKTFEERGKKAGEGFDKYVTAGLVRAAKALKNAQEDARIYGEVTGDATGAVNQSIKAHENYIAALVREAQIRGDADGKIKAMIAAQQEEIKALEESKVAAESYGQGLEKARKVLEESEKAARIYGEVTGDATGAVNQSIKAHEDYIAALVREAQAHGDADGAIQKAIAAQREMIAALEDSNKAAEGPGADYGKNLAASIEKYIPESVKKISRLFENMAPKMAGAGKGAAMGFAKAFGKLVPAVAPVFQAIIASSGGLLLVIGAIALAIKAIASGIKKAYDEQVAFNKAVNAQKDALEDAKRAIESINDVSDTTVKNYKSGERAAVAQHLIWKKIGDWFSNTFAPVLEGIKNTFATITNAVGFIANKLGIVSDEEVTAAIEAKKLESNYNAISEASKEYSRTLKEINLDSKKGDSDRLSAAQSYLDLLIQQRVLMAEKLEYEGAQIEEIDALIAAQEKERDKLAAIVESEKEKKKELTDQEKIIIARAAAEERYRETIAKINAEQAAGILTEKEAATARDGAMATWKDDLQTIVDEYNLTKGVTVDLLDAKRKIVGETEKQKRLEEDTKKLAEAQQTLEEDTLNINEQIQQQKIAQKKAEAEIAGTEEEKNRLLDEALRMELELLDTQREREKQAYKESDAFKLMYEKNKEGAVEWEAAFDQATEGMKAALIGLKKEMKEGFDLNGLAAGIGRGLGYFQDAASSILSITQRMAEDQITAIENLLEQQKELIDRQYEETMARLEEERQAALEAAGFVQAITEEGLEMSMQAAMESGDEGLIYKEKRRQEELAINKKYDAAEKKANADKIAAEKKAEEDAQREIAQINYQQSMAEWVNSLIQANVNIAEGITKAIAQGGILGIVTGAIVGALGALQIAAITVNKPKPPAFADGGVVGLPQTYRSGYANGGIVEANTPRGVDAVPIMAGNREMMLNDGQQANLFNRIANDDLGGGATTIVLQAMFNDEVFASRTVTVINNGMTQKIDLRMTE